MSSSHDQNHFNQTPHHRIKTVLSSSAELRKNAAIVFDITKMEISPSVGKIKCSSSQLKIRIRGTEDRKKTNRNWGSTVNQKEEKLLHLLLLHEVPSEELTEKNETKNFIHGYIYTYIY